MRSPIKMNGSFQYLNTNVTSQSRSSNNAGLSLKKKIHQQYTYTIQLFLQDAWQEQIVIGVKCKKETGKGFHQSVL